MVKASIGSCIQAFAIDDRDAAGFFVIPNETQRASIRTPPWLVGKVWLEHND
jgi:hypothetical protein